VSVATSAYGSEPPAADLARGSEISRSFNSDITKVLLAGQGIGRRELLHWRFWQDLAKTGTGGSIASKVSEAGLDTVDGLFWSHVVNGTPNSPRDEVSAGRLRDSYARTQGPLADLEIPKPITAGGTCGGHGCAPWLDPRLWLIYPGDRIFPEWLGGISRLLPGDPAQVLVRPSDRFLDVSRVISPDLLSRPNTRFASPVESLTDRLSHRLATAFVSVESPWTGTQAIREFRAGAGGTLQALPAVLPTGRVPSARVDARTVLSASERTLYLIGGDRVAPDGTRTPTNDLWRYSLDASTWQRVGREGALKSGASLSGVAAAAYDAPAHKLYLLGAVKSISALSTTNALSLNTVDTQSGAARSLATLPGLSSAARVSLVATADHTVIAAVQRTPSTIELHELDPTAARPAWIGFATLTGQLEDDLYAPDDLNITISDGGPARVITITREVLRQKVGASAAADRDRDGIPDSLDECPDAANPGGQACPTALPTVLYASNRLTLGDRVVYDPSALAASSGSATTSVGVEAQIGNLRSVGPVSLKDRARAFGSVLSAGAITLGNGASISGTTTANARPDVDTLAAFSVTFPAPGQAVNLEPGTTRSLAPGSYGALVAKADSVVYLDAGDYFFQSFDLESKALLALPPSGVTRIYVKDLLIFRGTIIGEPSVNSKLLLAYFGTADSFIESSFEGTLVAPKAKLVLGALIHYGAFYGRELDVQAGAHVVYTRFTQQWWPGGGKLQ